MLSRFLAVIAVIVLGVVVGFTPACRQNSTPATSANNSPPDKAAPSSSAEQPPNRSADQTPNRNDTVGTSGTDRDDKVMTTDLFRRIAKAENPVVVAITAQSHVPSGELQQYFGNDDFFSRFFGGRPQLKEQLRHTLGSGFLINTDGEILTNSHVVAEAEEIRVALFNDERTIYPADVIGRDALTDSALIKLKNPPASLPTATLGDSDTLEPGDWVMAIGNPFELGHTVTVGVISYKGRPFATSEGRFQNMLQTDASINPGNSGGPLIDVHGEVVGINTAILSGDDRGGNLGIGFAVPIDTVKTLLPQLRKGSVQRGQLGVQILSMRLTQDDAKRLGLPKAGGAIISRVEPGSPAERAGLHPGDIVVSYNGQDVPDADHLTSMVADTAPGTKVPIVYYRNGKQETSTVTLGALQLEKKSSESSGQQGADHGSGFGLSLGDLTPDLASQLHVPGGTQGAVVQNVDPFTPASTAGMRRGDVVAEVNRRSIATAADAARELRSLNSGQPADVLFWRNGVQQFVELRRE
jgi:serine protease Do